MEISLYRDLYKGYISTKRKDPTSKDPSLNRVLDESIKQTSEKLNIPIKEVKISIFNLSSISKFALNFPLDEDRVKKLYHDYESDTIHSDEAIKKSSTFYYDGNYIFDHKTLGTKQLDPDKFLFLALLALDKYRYIHPNKLTDYSYIMKLNNLGLPSIRWLQEQEKYLMNLSFTDILIIKFYTERGGVFVNSYLRDGKLKRVDINYFKNCPHFYKQVFFKYYEEKTGGNVTVAEILEAMKDKDEIKEFFKFFAVSLRRIISKSPEVDKEFIVYRGKGELHRSDEKKGNTYISPGFSSTSINKFVSSQFTNKRHDEKNAYLEKIIIPPRSRVLWVETHTSYECQFEVILPDSSQFNILEECQHSKILDKYKMSDTVCGIEHASLSEKIFLCMKNYMKSTGHKKQLSPLTPLKRNMCLIKYVLP